MVGAPAGPKGRGRRPAGAAPKVVRSALQNAASVASLMLTTEALIAEKPKKKAKDSGGGAPGGEDFGGDY